MTGARKRCWVAWAAAEQSHLLELEVAAEATVAEVLAAARALIGDAAVPWESAPVGIFGELCLRSARPRDGDRIELYRPLKNDPKEARRSRARPRGGG